MMPLLPLFGSDEGELEAVILAPLGIDDAMRIVDDNDGDPLAGGLDVSVPMPVVT
jgi:hypothetical protein